MRFLTAFVLLLVLSGCGGRKYSEPGLGASRLTAPSSTYRILTSQQIVRAGDRVRFRLEPPPPEGDNIVWVGNVWLLDATHGVYRAPYAITDRRTITLSAYRSDPLRSEQVASVEFSLVPSTIDGAEGALGPGQSFDPDVAGLAPPYMPLVDLPHVTHWVDPEFPVRDAVRGVRRAIIVRAYVDAAGRILDPFPAFAWTPEPFDGGDSPPERTLVLPLTSRDDLRLANALITALHASTFAPGVSDQGPVAALVDFVYSFGDAGAKSQGLQLRLVTPERAPIAAH